MTISEVAKQAKVGVETIRFYEREGLLEQPRKPVSGYRQYLTSHVERIRFLKQCQSFGFSLAEAGMLAHSLERGAATCEDACNLAERKLKDLKAKIAEYEALARRLENLVDAPCRRQQNAQCSVVDALTNGDCQEA
ncbi:MAG: MerR family transcriptional regulator [Acidobacteria bacterium]|nr:MerR family transcriptional regulator [Acidobacteriota bacterium]